jgi:hypothetical protein
MFPRRSVIHISITKSEIIGEKSSHTLLGGEKRGFFLPTAIFSTTPIAGVEYNLLFDAPQTILVKYFEERRLDQGIRWRVSGVSRQSRSFLYLRNFVERQPSDTDVPLDAHQERLLPTSAARHHSNRDTQGNRRVK